MIEVRQVYKSFVNHDGSRLHVLNGVSFSVEEGLFFTLLGPNGCGKTTLLKIVHGLLKADSGEVLIRGDPVTLPASYRSYMFQSLNLVPWKSVKENIALPLIFSGISSDEWEKKTEKLIKFLGLSGYERQFPRQLSGGLQQRVALARALVTDPQILLMDEPLSSLDAYTRELLQGELLKIIDDKKLTVLYVTHSVDEAIFMSDKICILTPRPATVKEILWVDLPKPRDITIKNTGKFASLRRRVWDILAA